MCLFCLAFLLKVKWSKSNPAMSVRSRVETSICISHPMHFFLFLFSVLSFVGITLRRCSAVVKDCSARRGLRLLWFWCASKWPQQKTRIASQGVVYCLCRFSKQSNCKAKKLALKRGKSPLCCTRAVFKRVYMLIRTKLKRKKSWARLAWNKIKHWGPFFSVPYEQ